MTAYSLDGVGYRAGGRRVLADISMDVHYGKVLALVGPNGAGKSTLLGLLTGDLDPTEGSIELDGRPMSAWGKQALARVRAVLLQSNTVAFSFTAQQIVEMGRAAWSGYSVDDDATLVAGAMRRADVTHLAQRLYPELSGGEAARVSLARVLAQETRIVLLDEPTAALDLKHQEAVLRLATTLAAEGKAVVVVLHDLSLAAAYADEIAMIASGSVVAVGDPHSVLTEQRINAVYETSVRVVPDFDSGLPVVLPRRGLRDQMA